MDVLFLFMSLMVLLGWRAGLVLLEGAWLWFIVAMLACGGVLLARMIMLGRTAYRERGAPR